MPKRAQRRKTGSPTFSERRIDSRPDSIGGNGGANGRIRTDDLLITNELLYQLSYVGCGKVSSNLAILDFKSSGRFIPGSPAWAEIFLASSNDWKLAGG